MFAVLLLGCAVLTIISGALGVALRLTTDEGRPGEDVAQFVLLAFLSLIFGAAWAGHHVLAHHHAVSAGAD